MKYCVNMVIICVNMVILRINKRFITICLIQKYIKIDKILNILEVHVKYRGKYGKTLKYDKILNILIVKYREKIDKNDKMIEKVKICRI